jgi:hypothetical protein
MKQPNHDRRDRPGLPGAVTASLSLGLLTASPLPTSSSSPVHTCVGWQPADPKPAIPPRRQVHRAKALNNARM